MAMFKHHEFALVVHSGLDGVKQNSLPRPVQTAEKKLTDAHKGITSQETDQGQKNAGGFDKQTWVENRTQFEGKDPTTQKKLEDEFKKFDTDGDGTMEEGEFLNLMRDRAATGGDMNIGNFTDKTAEKIDLSASEVKALNSGVKPKSEETVKKQQELNKKMADIDTAAAKPDATPEQKQQKADLDKFRTENPKCAKLVPDGREGPLTRKTDAALAQITRPAEKPLEPCVDTTPQPLDQTKLAAALKAPPAAGDETNALINKTSDADLKAKTAEDQRALFDKATSQDAKVKIASAMLESNPMAFDQDVIASLGNTSLETVIQRASPEAISNFTKFNPDSALCAIDTLDDFWSWGLSVGEENSIKALATGLLNNSAPGKENEMQSRIMNCCSIGTTESAESSTVANEMQKFTDGLVVKLKQERPPVQPQIQPVKQPSEPVKPVPLNVGGDK